MSRSAPTRSGWWRPAVWAGAVALAGVIGGVDGGGRNALVGSVLVAVAGMVSTRASFGPLLRPVRARDDGPGDVNEPFVTYRRLAAALGWSTVSRRHFDQVTRPELLALATRVARAAPGGRPGGVRELLGEQGWALVDPDRPMTGDSDPPGVGLDAVEAVVDRLSAAWPPGRSSRQERRWSRR